MEISNIISFPNEEIQPLSWTSTSSGPPTKVKKVKSPFQKELDAKLKERRKRGLCIELEEDDEEEKVENSLSLNLNPFEEDLESEVNPVNLEMNPKLKINVDSRYMQLLDELVNGDDIEESPTSPQKPYCDDSEEDNSEAETVVQMSPPVPLPRKKILDEINKEEYKESSQKLILNSDTALLQSFHEEARQVLLEDIQSAISTLTNEELLFPKISNDISNFESDIDTLQYFNTSAQYENTPDNKTLPTFSTDSLLDTLNFNSIKIEQDKLDNSGIDHIQKEIEEFNLLPVTATKPEAINTEKHNVDSENNQISEKEIPLVEKLIDFGLFDDPNGNILSMLDSSVSINNGKRELEILSHRDIETEMKDIQHSSDLSQETSLIPANVHVSVSLSDSSSISQSSEISQSKIDNNFENDISAQIRANNLFAKVLRAKKELMQNSKSAETNLKTQEVPRENQENNILEPSSKKEITSFNYVLDSPSKDEITTSRKQNHSKKGFNYSQKYEEYHKKTSSDIVKETTINKEVVTNGKNEVPKHNNQRANTFTMKDSKLSKEVERNVKSDVSKHNEPHLRKKKNEHSPRIHSVERIQSPRSNLSSNVLTKVPTPKSQEEMTYTTRRVRSAGSDRKASANTRLQMSANSSPARNKSCDRENASSIRKAVFDEWCQRKMEEKRKKLKELQQQEKEILEKKRKEEYEKRFESEQTFLAWKKRKESHLKKQYHSKKLEEEKFMLEEMERKKDAELAMQSWKKIKDDKFIKKKKETKKQETYKITLENDEREKEKQAAFEAWKAQKDAELRKKLLDKKKLEEEELKKHNEKIQKELEAIKAYEYWLDQKDKLYRQAKKERHIQKDHQIHNPNWSPPGKTLLVSYGHQKRCVS